jgi:hypothetical protein
VPKIPKILHYCFGYDRSFGGKPWSLVHFICVKSAIDRIKPDRAFIYYEQEPKGTWWRESCKLLTPIKIRAPREIFGHPLKHPAHRADVVRLETLIQHGGIYLDADVFVHQSFDSLLDNSVVLGAEGVNSEYGVANAVILAEPNAPFLKKWYEEYRSFRSVGRDSYWNEHSVRVPSILSKKYPNDLRVLEHTAFYWPLWTGDQLEIIYAAPPPSEARGIFANHLWESDSWEKYLEHLTLGQVRRIDSNFHRWAKPLVEAFPDEYGQPSLLDRGKRLIRLKKRRLLSTVDQLRQKMDRANRRGLFRSALYAADKLLSGRRYRRRIFSEVYEWKLWGGGNKSKYYSGIGSRGIAAATYVERISEFLNQYASKTSGTITVVDLGCGDFEIGRQLVSRISSMKYVGCDVVPRLIDHHKAANFKTCVQFEVVDIVADRLPDGDVCLIRQVFQHLSNGEIESVLRKLHKFKKVIITEAYPAEETGPINPDKPTNYEVRYDWRTGRGRGVELDKKPYCLPTSELFRVFADPKQVLITFDVNCAARLT